MTSWGLGADCLWNFLISYAGFSDGMKFYLWAIVNSEGSERGQVRGGHKMASAWCVFSPPGILLEQSGLSGACFAYLGYFIVTVRFGPVTPPRELYPLGIPAAVCT